MERYHGTYGLAALVGFFGIAILALVIFVTGQALTQLVAAGLLTQVAGIFWRFTFLALSLIFLHVARVLGATYLVDDCGITQRILGRRTTIAWADLVHFEETLSTEFGAPARYKLFAHDGRRIVIPFSSLADGARLEKDLAPLRERNLRDLASYGRRCRPDRAIGLAVLGFIAPMFCLGGQATFEQVSSGQVALSRTSAMLLGGLLVATGLVLAILGVERISRVLTVSTAGIALRSLFLDREIPFDRVQSITLRLVGEEPRCEYAKIRGDKLSITICSDMTGYRELVSLVGSRSKVAPVRAGDLPQLKTVAARRLLGRSAAVLGPPIMGMGCVMMLMGSWQLFSGGTAASDRSASMKLGIGAALLLAFVALAIVSHQVRSSQKAEYPEL